MGYTLHTVSKPTAGIGLAWDGAAMWEADGATTLYKLDAGGNVLASVAIPVPASPVYDPVSNSIFAVENNNSQDVVQVSLAGAIVNHLTLTSNNVISVSTPAGIACYGFTSVDVIDRGTGATVTSAPYAGTQNLWIQGLIYALGSIWSITSDLAFPFGRNLVQVTGGAVVNSYAIGQDAPFGFTFDGANFWTADATVGKVAKYSPLGVKLGSFPSGVAATGGLMAYLSGNIWELETSPAINIGIVDTTGAAILNAGAGPTGPQAFAASAGALFGAGSGGLDIFTLISSGGGGAFYGTFAGFGSPGQFFGGNS